MTKSTGKTHTIVIKPGVGGLIDPAGRSILVVTVQESLKRASIDLGRTTTFKKVVRGVVVPLLAVAGLSGCQSLQEKASASNATVAAAPSAQPPEAVAPTGVVAATSVATSKPAPTNSVISDRIVLAAKAAFEKNKCGVCHSVGAVAAAKSPATKRDLSGVGLTRSNVWISDFLQKKIKADGKLHMKQFAGTDAELAALSDWLASQKVLPKP